MLSTKFDNGNFLKVQEKRKKIICIENIIDVNPFRKFLAIEIRDRILRKTELPSSLLLFRSSCAM